MDRGPWRATAHRVTESDTTEKLSMQPCKLLNPSFGSMVKVSRLCADFLSGLFAEGGVPTIIIVWSISPFRSVSICLIYLGASRGSIHLWLFFFLMNWPLYHHIIAFLFSCYYFWLKDCFVWCTVATPALLKFSFPMEYLFQSLCFEPLCWSFNHVWLFVTPWTVAPTNSPVHGILQARIQEWIAIPFSTESSRLRERTHVSCTADRLFTVWAIREVTFSLCVSLNQKRILLRQHIVWSCVFIHLVTLSE